VCVECLFFKDTGVRPHLSVGLTSVRQKGGLPPVIPVPESLAAQGPGLGASIFKDSLHTRFPLEMYKKDVQNGRPSSLRDAN